MPKLTKRVVEASQPQEGRELFVYDNEIPGFFVRVYPSGRKVYGIQYRNRWGRTRRFKLGVHGILTAEKAREMARARLADVAEGGDPSAARAVERRAKSINDLIQLYQERHGPKLKESTRARYYGLFRRVIQPQLGPLAIAAVTRADVVRMHQANADSPVDANRSVRLLSKVLNLAETWGLAPIGSNPCRHIPLFKEKARKRYLTTEEFRRLGKALGELESEAKVSAQAAAAIRLAILTGARLRSELLPLTWGQVDLERRALRLPESKTGEKIIPLPSTACEVLESMERREGSPYVFPGKLPASHFSPGGIDKAWVRVRDRADLGDVRIHDLRHSFASVAVDAGYSLPVIGSILGHKRSTTTERYAHLGPAPGATAAEEIASRIDDAMNGEKE